MIKIQILISTFFLVFSFLFSLDTKEINYQLDISRAYVLLEKENYSEAGKIAKKMQRNKYLRADVFFILGEIHFKSKLFKTSLYYYKKADELEESFITESDISQNYLRMITCYQYIDQPKESIKFMKTILDRKKKNPRIINQKQGQIYFLLALTYRTQNIWAGMNEYFLKAIQNNYFRHTAYFFLLNYYANYFQNEINQHFKLHFSQEFKIPNRKKYFLYYLRVWKDLSRNANEKNWFETNKDIFNYPKYEQMKDEIVNYNKTLKFN